jgi:hemerythrin-like domain-containing protein
MPKAIKGEEPNLNATQNLKNDHALIKRIRNISQTCSNKLYADQFIPITDIEIISVIVEEFVDKFHHGKEEKAYFPGTRDKNGFSEDIRKFIIEHELGRRIAMMLRREINEWKRKMEKGETSSLDGVNRPLNEPVARFLKSYAVFLDEHIQKEDKFFDLVEEKDSITDSENEILLKYYETCKNQAGGEARMTEMVRLIEYLEAREWMEP